VAKDTTVPVDTREVGNAINPIVPGDNQIKSGMIMMVGQTLSVQSRERLRPGVKVYFNIDDIIGWFFDTKIPGDDKRLALLRETDILVSEREIGAGQTMAWADSLVPKR
jgi:hypothetical protein